MDAWGKKVIILEGIKGHKTMTEICWEHQINQTVFYRWRDCLLEGGRKRISRGVTNETKALREEIEKLQEIIGW